MDPLTIKAEVTPMEGFGPPVGLQFMLFYLDQRDPEIM